MIFQFLNKFIALIAPNANKRVLIMNILKVTIQYLLILEVTFENTTIRSIQFLYIFFDFLNNNFGIYNKFSFIWDIFHFFFNPILKMYFFIQSTFFFSNLNSN